MTRKLRTPQRKAIAALLAERSIVNAAAVVGVGESTLYRWLRDPEFVAELERAEMQVIGEATRIVIKNASEAIECLVEMYKNPDVDDTNRRLAATQVANQMTKLRELHVLERRIAELEERLNG